MKGQRNRKWRSVGPPRTISAAALFVGVAVSVGIGSMAQVDPTGGYFLVQLRYVNIALVVFNLSTAAGTAVLAARWSILARDEQHKPMTRQSAIRRGCGITKLRGYCGC